MELTPQQLEIISNALHNVQRLLYSDLDCICDEEYEEETLSIIDEVNKAIEIVT